ncbi:MAG: NADH-quinone oxidoreductase subunit [Acidimicrobiales bacterium]|nr:MAG: NADH-quinone oxidoreductase subunit [Acidimicrobiales bacterium]
MFPGFVLPETRSLGSPFVSDFLRSYLTVGIFGLVAVVLVAALLGIGRILRPSNPTTQKLETYESGVDPTGDMWSQSNIRYYIFALLFVMFDVEAVFIFPWATRLEAYALFGLIEMAIFIYILLLGLLYAWRKGMLRWV